MHEMGIEKEKYLEELYYAERRPLYDPEDFLADGDEYHVITGRHENLKVISEKWIKKYCPNAKSINVVGGRPWYDFIKEGENGVECWSRWNKVSCQNKIEKIKELGIDVFYDDSASNIKQLRAALPNLKVIQLGGRLSQH